MQSNIEKIIESWLIQKNIKYIKQYKFEDCKYLRCLPFDFYLEEWGLIEVDGVGHYEITRFNGIDEDRAKDIFEKTKIRDTIKTQYCKDNNIKLLRIPYWDIENKNYKKILSLLFVH